MALELTGLLAGFPLAASFAIAGGISFFREGRRRSSLNEAVHELRRPLQALALALPAGAEAAGALDSSLRLAAAAVDRLDHEINGGRALTASAPVVSRPMVEAAVERWQARATHTNRPLVLDWRGGNPLLYGDGIELGQALDNMISNGFEHGDGEVSIAVRRDGDFLCIAVHDQGQQPSSSQGPGLSGSWVRLGGRARHGHGLRVVRRVAAQHGGSFRLRRSPRGTEARLELPLRGGHR